jgi:hypothetical protein
VLALHDLEDFPAQIRSSRRKPIERGHVMASSLESKRMASVLGWSTHSPTGALFRS